jgi:pimeloyl-ACP methyl ester carboxylesterase
MRRLSAILLGVAAVGNVNFLVATLLPGTLPPGSTFISELAARGQPYSTGFRAAELVTGLALVAGVAAGWLRAPRNRWLVTAGAALALLGLLTAIDCLMPLDCPPSSDPACRAAEIAGTVSFQHQVHTTTGVLETLAALVACAALTAGTRYSAAWWTTTRVAGWVCLLQVGAAVFIAWLWLAEVNAFGWDQRLATFGMSILLTALAVSLARHEWDPSGPPQWPNPGGPIQRITVTVPPGQPSVGHPDRLSVTVHCPTGWAAGTGDPPAAKQGADVGIAHRPGHGRVSAAPVLFINGLSLPARLWEPVIAACPQLHAICYDRPGIGTSTGDPGPDLRTQVSQLRAVLQAAAAPCGELGRVVLVAHSHGALAATTLARTDPHLVAALVLVDPSLPKPLHPVSLAVQRTAGRVMAAGARRRWSARIAGRATTWLQLRAGTARPQCYWPPRDIRASMADQVHLQAALAELAIEPDDLRVAAEIADSQPLPPIPVTVMAGALAGWPGYYRVRTWVRRLDSHTCTLRQQGAAAHLEVLQSAHLLMLDAPGDVARIVTEMSQRTA